MASRGLRKLGAGRFQVDFAQLLRPGCLLARWLRSTDVEIDPFTIGQAVQMVLEQCDVRSVRGKPLVWNEIKIFLSDRDYQALVPLERRLRAGLGRVVRETLAKLDADTVGDLVVRVLVDEEGQTPPGRSEIVAAFVETADLAPDRDGEQTVRVARPVIEPRDPTQPIREPEVEGAVRLRWDQGEALIPPQVKLQVGRPNPKAPERFIALLGASRKINSYQMALENTGDAVVIARPVKANPVQVAGRLVQPGGKLRVSKLPVKISLSNGEMILELERPDGDDGPP